MAKELAKEKILKMLTHLGLLKKKRKKRKELTGYASKSKPALAKPVSYLQPNLIGLPPTKSVIVKDTSDSHGRFESRQEGIRQPPQIIYIRNTEPVKNVMNPTAEGYSIYDGDGVISSYTAPLRAQIPVSSVGHLSVGGGGGGGSSYHSHLEPIIGSRQRFQEEERTTFDNVQPMPARTSPYPKRAAPPLPQDALPSTEALYTVKRRGRPPGSKNKPKERGSDVRRSDPETSDFEDNSLLQKQHRMIIFAPGHNPLAGPAKGKLLS